MMMFGNGKKFTSLILGKRDSTGTPSEAPVQAEKSFDPQMDKFHALAEDLHLAIKNNSVGGIADVLKAHHELGKNATSDDTAE